MIHDPDVHVVVWGGAYPAATESAVRELVRGLAGSVFGRVLSQYYDATGHVNNDIHLEATWTDAVAAPRSVNTAQIRSETQRAIAQAGWRVTPDTVIIVLLPPGVRTGGCGFHAALLSAPLHETSPPIAVVPYQAPACGFGLSATDEATYATSHELSESITDPYNAAFGGPSGWWNLGGPPLGEVADACEPGNSRVSLPGGDTPIVANLFSLTLGRCVSFG